MKKISENTKKVLFVIAVVCIVLASVHLPFDGKMTIPLPIFLLLVFAGVSIKV